MTLRKLRAGDLLAGAAGVALVAVLFAPWFGQTFECVRAPCPQPHSSAWHSLSVVLAFLLLAALSALVLVAVTAFERSPALPVAVLQVTLVSGPVAVVLVVIRLVVPPDGQHPRWGAWVGLLCTIAITAGAWTSLRDAVRP